MSPERAQHADGGTLPSHAPFDFIEDPFEQRQHVNLGKLEVTAAGIGEEIRNDGVETLGLASNNLDEHALLIGERRDAVQNIHRSTNRCKGIADLVRDSACQAANGSLLFTDANFPLQATDLREIVESIDVAGDSAARRGQAGGAKVQGQFPAQGRDGTNFAVRHAAESVGQRLEEKRLHGLLNHSLRFALQQAACGGVGDLHPTVKAGRDDATGNGLDNVLVEGLEIFELSAGMPQTSVRLTQALCQSGSQISDREIGEKIDEDNREQGARAEVSRGVGRQDIVVTELKHGPVGNESSSGDYICPGSREQDTGDDNYQRIEKVVSALGSARNVNEQGGHTQVGKDLKFCLDDLFAPGRSKDQEKH